MAILVKAGRAVAQDEDYGAYRHEFYREDDHRMSIDTDSASFDIAVKPLISPGLLSEAIADHVRLTGSFTYDGISGATPTGAPPQSQWTFPTYGSFYNQAYNGIVQSLLNNPGNLTLYQAGLFPNYQAYSNYVVMNNPGIGGQATNAANAQYSSLTNSPSYRNSKQVPLTLLHDIRRAYSVGLPISFNDQVFTPQLSLSRESDYHSYGLAFNYQILLNEKNTTLNAGWSHNVDRVRDNTLVVWQGKVSDDFLIGINQLLTPKSYLTLDLTYGQEYGYLSDPYRGVMFAQNNTQFNPEDASLTPEKRPRRRTQEIVYAAYTQFYDPLNGSAVLGYRFFHDSYGIYGQTVESTWNQKIGKRFVISPGARIYYQTAAKFYAVIFPDAANPPEFYSSDYRLSRMMTANVSVSMTYRVQKHFSIDLTYMRYIMMGLDGVTSQSAYPSANVGSVGARVWF